MQKWERAAQARRVLDRRFASGLVADLRTPPTGGWVRAVRTALAMSQADLAKQLGVSAPAVADLERAEGSGGLTLRRLERVAEELDCTLVYALVPNATLEDAVQRRARTVAAASVGYVGRTMELEAQGIDHGEVRDLLDREARRVIEQSRLWRSP